jgi:type IV pilus assembly protein PilW
MNNHRASIMRRQRGMSLVELMVAMTIGLVITVVIANLFLGTKQTYRTQDDLSRMQENLRFAFQVMGRVTRQAGYRADWNRTIDAVFGVGVSPIDGTNGTGANGSDTLIVRFQGSGAGTSGANCLATNSCGGADGRVLDCLGNRVDRQMGPAPSPYAPVFNVTFVENWLRVRTGGANGGTALFCSVDRGTTWVEIVPDIDNMQVLYGEKTGPTAVDRYLAAGTAGLSMGLVLNVRVALLHRSANLTAGATDTRTYNLVGTAVGPFNDQRIRLAATTNFVLRNRTQ